jgi:hypothetical protein
MQIYCIIIKKLPVPRQAKVLTVKILSVIIRVDAMKFITRNVMMKEI